MQVSQAHAGADTGTSRRRARVNSDYLMFHRKSILPADSILMQAAAHSRSKKTSG